MKKTGINSILFAVLVISFLLPFIEISCGNQSLKTVTGFQLVTGFKIERPVVEKNKPAEKKIKGEPLTRIAFGLAILGFILSFLKNRLVPKILAIMGLAGAGLMLFLKTKIDQKIAETGVGLLAVNYKFGFWLVAVLFTVVFLANLLIPEKQK